MSRLEHYLRNEVIFIQRMIEIFFEMLHFRVNELFRWLYSSESG